MSGPTGILENLNGEGVKDASGRGISLWVLATEIDDAKTVPGYAPE